MIKFFVLKGKQIKPCENCDGHWEVGNFFSVDEPLLILPDGVDFEGLKDKYIKIVNDTFMVCVCGNVFLRKRDEAYYVGVLAKEEEDDVQEWLRRSAKRHYYRCGERSQEEIVLMKDGELHHKHMSDVNFTV